MAPIKVLYYNWVDYDDPEKRGGGVSIYQRNLIDAALARGDSVCFLSSGLSYSPLVRRPFIRRVSGARDRVCKFDLVNSPVFSPGHAAFGQDVSGGPDIDAVFAELLRTEGPFDVIHFNNLEGVPVSFLRLAREHHPGARVVLSLHNYFTFCPQVNLWFQERTACKDYRQGKKCVNCLPAPPGRRATKRTYQVDYCLRRLGLRPQGPLYRLGTWLVHGPIYTTYRSVRTGVRALAWAARWALGRRKQSQPARPVQLLDAASAAKFARRRQLFLDAVNEYADHVLAVSQRVAELAVGFGIDAAKVETAYIGTRFARQTVPRPAPQGQSISSSGAEPLRIAYLGYMRSDKGFYFYLDALKKMPEALASRLALVFAAKITDRYALFRIKQMAHRFAAVTFFDGYTHAQLPRVLAEVDLGIVPVLWEDNLPQVAIECVGSGVPVLTSDRGGARELLDCPELVFRAGSFTSLFTRLRAIMEDPSILTRAMAGRRRLFTPEEHYDHLRERYYQCMSQVSTAPAAAASAPKEWCSSLSGGLA